MRPTTARNDRLTPVDISEDNVFNFNALLHPSEIFRHPRDVVESDELSLSEKRAILTSWASDAAAVASRPALRAPPELSAPVTIDEVLEAGRRVVA
jgi:hypothetical protein